MTNLRQALPKGEKSARVAGQPMLLVLRIMCVRGEFSPVRACEKSRLFGRPFAWTCHRCSEDREGALELDASARYNHVESV
jgi:hypothetical protein